MVSIGEVIMLKKRINYIIFTIFIIFSCTTINETKIYDRINYHINFNIENITDFSAKFDFIEENYAKNIFSNDKELREKLGHAYKMVATEETAIKIAEAIYMESLGNDIEYYKPFYAVLYKNVWIVYGCYNIEQAVETAWQDIGEWDEAIIIISKHTGEIWGKTPVFQRSTRNGA